MQEWISRGASILPIKEVECIMLCVLELRLYTVFVEDVKHVKVSTTHNEDVFSVIRTEEAIFSCFWDSCSIEKARVLRHIQGKSLK